MAQEETAPVAATEDEPMPEISEEERKLILQGTWWDLNPSVLPDADEMDKLEEASTGVPPSLAGQETIVDPFPEDLKTVHEQFLPEYIRKGSGNVIDPQRLLNEVEKEDVVKLIASLELKYGVKVYVSIFAPGQEVPPEINAPTLARQIFDGDRHSLLLHAHYGEVTTLQVACDSKWMAQLGDQGRRALLAKIKESSSLYTDAQDSLVEAIASMVLFAQPGMQEMLREEKEIAAAKQGKVPEVDIDFTEEEKQRKSHLGDFVKGVFEKWHHYIPHALGFILFLGLLVAAFLWRRNIKPVKLLPSESDRRLGAPYGAGVSRVVSYGDKDDSNPDSFPRQQMRDHLRDIS